MPPPPHNSLLEEISELVRIPSRGGLDDYTPVLDAVQKWLRQHDVDSQRLRARGRDVGICGEIRGNPGGPLFLLNATVDTAPYGDRQTWSHDPLSAEIADGWLYGRGSADSKAGVAIFCHVLAALRRESARLRGTMAFLFDAEEHTGGFVGVRHFVKLYLGSRSLAGVMIGYPGHERIVIGCRGFFRATATVRGQAAHSGSSKHHGSNAITRAAELIRRLENVSFDGATDSRFPLPPQVTVTAVRGGGGFSTVPDRCQLNVDFRLTPSFTTSHARALLEKVIGELDREAEDTPRTEFRAWRGWPAYRLEDDARVYQALREAVRRVIGSPVPGVVAGPSSVGNYLATLGVAATSGFGVNYRNLHAADECIDVASIDPTYQVYLTAALLLLE